MYIVRRDPFQVLLCERDQGEEGGLDTNSLESGCTIGGNFWIYLFHVTDHGRFLALRPGPWTSVGLRFPNMRHQQDRDLWPRTAVNARKVRKKKTQLHYHQCTKYLLRCSSNTVSTR